MAKKEDDIVFEKKIFFLSSVKDMLVTPVNTFSAFMNTTESIKAGRIPEVPYHESFLATSTKLLLLIKALQDHGRSCSGNIVTRRSNIVMKRLSLSVAIYCTCGKICKIWEKGHSSF